MKSQGENRLLKMYSRSDIGTTRRNVKSFTKTASVFFEASLNAHQQSTGSCLYFLFQRQKVKNYSHIIVN